jgi:hypothetical protein
MIADDIFQKWREAIEEAKNHDESSDVLRKEELREVQGITVRSGIKAGPVTHAVYCTHFLCL